MARYAVTKVLYLEAPLEAAGKEASKWCDDGCKRCQHHCMELQHEPQQLESGTESQQQHAEHLYTTLFSTGPQPAWQSVHLNFAQ